MIRRKYLLLFVMSFTLLLVGCDNDLGHQSPNDEWIAETLVSEVDVEHSGVDAWFYSEAISDPDIQPACGSSHGKRTVL